MFESSSLILAFWVSDYAHSNTDMRNCSGLVSNSIAHQNGFSCLYLNARSLKPKMSEFLTVVESLQPDVTGVTERWGTHVILDSEFSIPGYDMYRSDRSNGHRGGGVLLRSSRQTWTAQITTTWFPERWLLSK